MKTVFADTSYWIALTNIQDAAHGRAKALSISEQSSLILTTESVLIEYLNYFAAWGPHFRRVAVATIRALVASPTVHIEPHNDRSFLDGMELYAARPDKGYSLTDCVSMQTMRRGGLIDVLTDDRHFEQEGFRAVFRV